ncbi:MAG: AAA family ATPase [Acidimicrobiaceae bacterium]|nr:AAA family ATPase [Acidimicrobiia bacterium]MCY4492509.1 AAA family ATPase [Acidimicrobiaceae bacterium]
MADTNANAGTETAGVRVSSVVVRDFRCVREVQLDLAPGTTYLVGENNSGKTSILLALWSALGSRRPLDDDLRRKRDDALADEATVDLLIVPATGSRFSPRTAQEFLLVQRDPSNGTETVGIRTKFLPSREGRWLTTRRMFLQPDAAGRWQPVDAPALPPALMSRIEAHMLDASRDLVSELGNRTSVWGRVLSDLQIEEEPSGSDGRADLEGALEDVARRIREASPVLSNLQSDLARLSDAQSSVGTVELQPMPLRLEELARAAEVVLHQHGEPALPLRLNGLGSRSLATLLVFQTLAKLRLGADREEPPHLLTLLEEPEAHLHPQATSALPTLLNRLPGQRVVTTHSPQLVAQVDPQDVRIIRRSGTGVEVLGLPPETAKRAAQFRRYVERPFGEIMFARAIVLCDGTSERCALPILLSAYFDCHPGGLGVSFIDCESMNHPHTNTVVQAAHDLKLPWLLFTDHDGSGETALSKVVHPETSERLTPDSPEVIMSGEKQIEQLLIDAGYINEIEQVAADSGIEIGSGKKPHLKFLTDNKAWAAEQVAAKAMETGQELPDCIEQLGQKLKEMLEREGGTPRETETE